MVAMTHQVFTPAQANRTLPLVRRIVEDILVKGREIRQLASKAGTEAGDELHALKDEINAYLAELTQIGCYYKDWSFDKGLVDYPAEIDGEVVYLCWRSDEPRLAYYHTLDGGFAARKPIPRELLDGTVPTESQG
jgi:hypothetical protein